MLRITLLLMIIKNNAIIVYTSIIAITYKPSIFQLLNIFLKYYPHLCTFG